MLAEKQELQQGSSSSDRSRADLTKRIKELQDKLRDEVEVGGGGGGGISALRVKTPLTCLLFLTAHRCLFGILRRSCQRETLCSCLLFLTAPAALLINQVRDRELQGVRASLKKALEDKESSVGATKEKVCASVGVEGEVCAGVSEWHHVSAGTAV